MGQLVRGGGLKGGINIMGLTGQLQGVATNYKLAIPPYFALVLRAFSVIEGIALKVRLCIRPLLCRRLSQMITDAPACFHVSSFYHCRCGAVGMPMVISLRPLENACCACRAFSTL